MIKSMTGFGGTTISKDTISINVEVKTLNSKYFDLALKLPRIISDKEIEIRSIITEYLVRGKINLSVQFENTSEKTIKYTINQELFDNYLAQFKEIESNSGREFSDILKLTLDSQEVVVSHDESIDDESWGTIKDTLIDALKSCNKSREAEGEKLTEILNSYIHKIRTCLAQIQEIEPNRLLKIKDKLKNNIQELTDGIDYDAERLEQELIYYSEKLDINEEIERLGIHLDSYQQTLISTEDQHGKRLGFISQEMGREINTIGSKANDADIQKQVIQMKEELEKIKEQTLNIL